MPNTILYLCTFFSDNITEVTYIVKNLLLHKIYLSLVAKYRSPVFTAVFNVLMKNTIVLIRMAGWSYLNNLPRHFLPSWSRSEVFIQNRDHLFLRDITAHLSLSFTRAKGVRCLQILMQYSPRRSFVKKQRAYVNVRLPENVLCFIDL